MQSIKMGGNQVEHVFSVGCNHEWQESYAWAIESSEKHLRKIYSLSVAKKIERSGGMAVILTSQKCDFSCYRSKNKSNKFRKHWFCFEIKPITIWFALQRKRRVPGQLSNLSPFLTDDAPIEKTPTGSDNCFNFRANPVTPDRTRARIRRKRLKKEIGAMIVK